MAATTLPRARRRRNLWSPATEAQLWARISQRENRPISGVIREFCRETGMSYHTARAKYYRRLRAGTEPAPTDTVLEDLAAFLRDASGLPGVNLGGLIGGLRTLAALAMAADGLGREREELGRRLADLERRLGLLKEQHRELGAMVAEFAGQTSIDKVTGLEEFTRRLQAALDRLGQVLL